MKQETFSFFWKGPLSQWARSDFRANGVDYTCAEQYMMHQKALLFGDTEKAQEILDAGFNPKRHKQLGREVKPFDPDKWNDIAKDIVYNGSDYKFQQNPQLMKQLELTMGTTVVEASPFDTVWGIGLGPEDPRITDRNNWRGKNWLGEVLTELRVDIFGE